MDAHKNFALGTVATAPSPATTGTSLVLAAGEGAGFPAAPFNVTIYPAGATPTRANAEIARCTAKSTDTLTITRAQEGSTARTVIVGDTVVAAITAKSLTDIEGTRSALSGGPPASPGEGDLWIATGIDADGTEWLFKYNSSETTYKWKFLGGSAQGFYGAMVASLTPASTWVTVKALALARAGDYQVRGGFRLTFNSTVAHNILAGIAITSPGATNVSSSLTVPAGAGGYTFSIAVEDRINAAANGGNVILSALSFATTGGTDATIDGYIAIVPVRIS